VLKMSDNPTLIQMQEQIRDIFAKVLDVNPEDIKKEVNDTLSQQEVRLKGMKQLDDGRFVQGNIVIKQTGKNRFQIAGTIREDSESYVIGKEIECAVESIPTVLLRLVSDSRVRKPKKKGILPFSLKR